MFGFDRVLEIRAHAFVSLFVFLCLFVSASWVGREIYSFGSMYAGLEWMLQNSCDLLQLSYSVGGCNYALGL